MVKSPETIVPFSVMLLCGQGVTWVLFIRPGITTDKWLPRVLGVAYPAFIFVLLNFKMVFFTDSPPTWEEIQQRIPHTLAVALAILFLAFITSEVLIRRQASQKKRTRDAKAAATRAANAKKKQEGPDGPQ